jgi:hypothetical protein
MISCDHCNTAGEGASRHNIRKERKGREAREKSGKNSVGMTGTQGSFCRFCTCPIKISCDQKEKIKKLWTNGKKYGKLILGYL